MRFHLPTRATLLLCLATLVVVAPTPLSARDCGADYLTCLWDSGAIGTSDRLHETACYGDYMACVARSLRVF